MAALPAPPLRSHSLPAVTGGSTFWTTHRLPSIVESRYARDYIPKFQAKFGVAEEEPDGPFQRLVQRYRQGLGDSSVVITLDLYSHVLPNMQEKLVNVVANLLKRTPAVD